MESPPKTVSLYQQVLTKQAEARRLRGEDRARRDALADEEWEQVDRSIESFGRAVEKFGAESKAESDEMRAVLQRFFEFAEKIIKLDIT